MSSSAQLKQKLIWITVFRAVAASLLLLAAAARFFSRNQPQLTTEETYLFVIIGLEYVATLVYGVLLRQGPAGPRHAAVQIGGDILFASALVYLTGGPDSPFTFVYLLAVLAAAILLDRRGALVAAAGSTGALLALVSLVDGLGVYAPNAPWAAGGRLLFILSANVLGQLLVAALAAYLASQLSKAGVALEKRSADLVELAALHQQILTSMPSGLIATHADRTIAFINRAALQILSLEESPSRGVSVDSIIPGVSEVKPGTRRGEISVETRNGPRVLGLSVVELQQGGHAELILFQDLSDLRRAENELRRLDKLVELGRLSAQLAHEIRNPLASMRGSAQLLAEAAPDCGDHKRLSAVLMRESDRLSRMLDDFLKFARPPAPQRAPVRVDALIEQTVQMLRTDPSAVGIAISTELEPLDAHLDADQLKQVLINLLRNAFAAVGAKGRVQVTVGLLDGEVDLRVWDSAGTIAQDDMAHLFEPFFTKKAGGTGLGLATAHSIIRAHGGTLRATSSPSTGTEFRIRLPTVGEVP